MPIDLVQDGIIFKQLDQVATYSKFPLTLKELDLAGRIRSAGGSSLREAGEFFGWEPGQVTKTASDFTKDELTARGWSKSKLLEVAVGYEHVARITPTNLSAALRAVQLREIAELLD